MDSCFRRDNSLNLLPLAGKGARFASAGYTTPKPLIPVCGEPMVLRAERDFPPAARHVFVALKEHLDHTPLAELLHQRHPGATIVALDEVTEGQACTVAAGLSEADGDAPLFIGACDHAMRYSVKRYAALRARSDAIVFTFRNHPCVKRNPHMYGYVAADAQGRATAVSVKRPLSDTPTQDHAITGAFYFKKAAYFSQALAALIRADTRINGEFYVDSVIAELIAQGKDVRVFEVEHYACFGTPDDLRTYEYWQEYFHG